jgi:hypothetical protein
VCVVFFLSGSFEYLIGASCCGAMCARYGILSLMAPILIDCTDCTSATVDQSLAVLRKDLTGFGNGNGVGVREGLFRNPTC